MQTETYLFVGLPATLVLIGEGLISLNEAVIAEQADYRLISDYQAGLPYQSMDVPGPTSPRPTPVDKTEPERYRRYLVELFCPVIVHKISHHPEWDIPVLIDYDGNDDPMDNLLNESKNRPHLAGVHGEVTAETTDSYYLTYSLYHIKDYDHPIRETLLRWTYHDNDNEGFHIRVDKTTMGVVEAETWFHNRFLLFNQTGESHGTEPVHGRMYFEDETHIIIYGQSQGHGVRCAQLVDLPAFKTHTKIMRYRGDRQPVRPRTDTSVEVDITYEMDGFDKWYAVAQGPLLGESGDASAMFDKVIPLNNKHGGAPRKIGRFISCRDYYVGGWSRPKPMWSWDDGWDEVPILVWHFFPSYSFESHGGQRISHRYLYNRPCELVYGQEAGDILASLDLPILKRGGKKWEDLEGRGGHVARDMYWRAFVKSLKAYVNYLFRALG
jgi:hypothetical protein